ncbi:MAG TPA: DUF1648 domain-containing protein [Candidatus Baltobacteraceae bacterium]|jgi:uncharacterized membrane protein|nr:DUF1648 domain-containing protein [Candidatus Baltobacteraceae bacterium]
MVVVLIALAAGLIAATVAMTAARYGDLPESIPVHFGIDGRADSYGPRPIIWLPAALQGLEVITSLLLYAFGAAGAVTLITAICVAAMLFWLVINWQTAAITRSDRLSMGQFALVAVIITLAGLAAARIVR